MSVIFRIIKFLYDRIGGIRLLILIILIIEFRSLVNGITGEIIDVQPVFLIPFAMGAVLLGWLVGMSSIPGLAAFILLIILGMEWVLLRVGQIWTPFAGILQLTSQVVVWFNPSSGLQITLPNFLPAITHFGMELSALVMRIFLFGKAVSQGQSIVDPVVVSLIWSLSVYCLSAWAAWWTTRHKAAWLGFLPGAAAMAGVFAFTDSGFAKLIWYSGFACFTQFMLNFFQRESSWEARHIDTPNLRGDFARSAAIISVTLVGIAWLTPSISPQDVKDFVDDVFTNGNKKPSPGETLGLKPRPGHTQPFQDATRPGLARTHLIGSGPELRQNVVMVVSIAGYNPTGLVPQGSHPDEAPQIPPRLYWRSLTYDHYSGRGWSSSPFTEADMAANVALTELDLISQPYRKVIVQHIQGIGNLENYLYVSGELVSADQPYRVGLRTYQDLVGATTEETEYTSTSLTSVATPALLRSTGSTYPEWIRQRYLSLPDDIAPRVRELAFELTATKSNPYDRATAIEQYLRQIPYTLDVDAPPIGVEITEFFIFELKKGYCDYYATSMVVLARAAGLPARLVTGYASGNWDPVKAAYVVTEADAHSWAEVYFPGYGWVEFEPTGGLPRLAREEDELPASIFGLPKNGQPTSNNSFPVLVGKSSGLILTLVIFGVCLLGYFLVTQDQRRLYRMSGLGVIAVLYHRMLGHTRLLLDIRDLGLTPYEFRQQVISGLNTFADQALAIRPVASRLVDHVYWLVDLYVRVTFSQAGLAWMDKEIAIRRWPYILRDLLVARSLKTWLTWKAKHLTRR